MSDPLTVDERRVLKYAPSDAQFANITNGILRYYMKVGDVYWFQEHDRQAGWCNLSADPAYPLTHNVMELRLLESRYDHTCKEELPRSKYNRVIRDKAGSTIDVDVYDVLEAFNLTCPALQHAAKKILCAGIRGHKDVMVDLDDAIASIERGKDLQHNRDNT